METPECFQFVGLLKDSILSICAILGTVVAWRGLNTWKQQLEWNENNNLAKNLLVQTYKLRDGINDVRNPFMSSAEMDSAMDDQTEKLKLQEWHSIAYSKAYERRWEKIVEARQNLYSHMLEAEALWGGVVTSKFDPINKKIFELNRAVRDALQMRDPRTDLETRKLLNEGNIARRKTMFARNDETDDYKNELDQIIESIESFLKPQLGRKSSRLDRKS